MSDAPGLADRLATSGLSLAATGVAFANGMTFSPLYDTVLYQLQLLAAPVSLNPAALYAATPGMLGLLTLALGGIPAALYERWRGQGRSSAGSALIWLLATALLALPGLLGGVGFFELE